MSFACTRFAFAAFVAAVVGLFAPLADAQLSASVDVDVTEENGIYTYEYTLTNSFLSSASVSYFAIDTGRGRNLAQGEYTEYGARLLDAPGGWVGVYYPFKNRFDANGVAYGVEVFSLEQPTPTLASDNTVNFVATNDPLDPFACGSSGDVLPGTSTTFTIKSPYRPGNQAFEFSDCTFLQIGSGMAQAPTVPPTPPLEGCDFDGNGSCDAADLDMLGAAITLAATDRWLAGPDGVFDDLETEVVESSDDIRFLPDLYFDATVDGEVDVADVDSVLNGLGRVNGDLDLNGLVEFADFLILSGNFGQAASWSEGDIVPNGQVDFADFLIFSGNFGKTVSENAAAVPEPSSWLGLLAGMIVCGLLRRNRRAQ